MPGRQRSERCKRGHLLSETRRARAGRPTSTYCVACHAISNAAYRQKRDKPEPLHKGGSHEQMRLPFAPLERLYLLEYDNLSRVFNGNSLKRWRTEGVPILTADELCCRIGRHPGEVYGQAWWAA